MLSNLNKTFKIKTGYEILFDFALRYFCHCGAVYIFVLHFLSYYGEKGEAEGETEKNEIFLNVTS